MTADDLPEHARKAVIAKLAEIRGDHRVIVPFAIESGSRAWGFPSPDSDFDCRFLFVRPHEDYLSLFPKRDVIELPIEDELDVNGWDVGKAIKLILRGNAVAIEWLMSPIVYVAEPELQAALLAFGRRRTDRRSLRRHYFYLGRHFWDAHLDGGGEVPLKKVFYALRPALALRWLDACDALPPMHFPTLLAECDCPRPIAEITRDLLDRKARTRELGSGPLPPQLYDFLKRSLGDPDRHIAVRVEASDEAKEDADAVFRDLVTRFAPSSRAS